MSQMIDIDEFLPKVLQYARNAPEPTVKTHLRDIMREFCAASRIWREVDSFTVSAPDYEILATTPDTDLLEFEECYLGETKLTPKGVAELDVELPGWRYATETGTARYVTQLEPDTLRVVPLEAGTLQMTLVLQPSQTAGFVPDFLLNKYGTQLGRGTAARLMLLPGTEFSNPQLAAPLLSEFNGWMAATTHKVGKGQQKSRKRSKPVFF